MGFQRGHKKLGGRTRGTPNKNSLKIEDQLHTHGIDAVAIIAEKLPYLPPEKAVDVATRLLPYLYPTKRQIDLVEPPSSEGILNEFSAQAVASAVRSMQSLKRGD